MEILPVSTSNSTTVGPHRTGGTNDGVAAAFQQSQIHQHMLILKYILYQDYQGRLLASFQDDAKYEHVGQDTRSQGGKDLKEKDLKISKLKTNLKDNDKSSRSKITQHDRTRLQQAHLNITSSLPGLLYNDIRN
ncbi:hypothetical protein Tco_0734639 [Tanacetum coccineum]